MSHGFLTAVRPKGMVRRKTPSWVLASGASAAVLDIDFVNNRAWSYPNTPTIASLLPCTRTAAKYIPNAAGVLLPFATNVLARTDLGLSVEEQRINLALQSQTLATSPWSASQAGAFADEIAAPDGTTTAERVLANDGAGYPSVFQGSIGVAGSTPYAASCFIKPGTVTKACIELRFNTGDDGSEDAEFTFSGSGTATPNGASTLSPTGVIAALGSSWYACAAKKTSPGGVSSAVLIIRPAGIGDAGSGGRTVYSWGAQVEAGAFPTSYIPTTSASATRDADLITGLPALPSAFTDYVELGDAQGSAVILGAGASTSLIERISSTQVKATDGSTTITATVGSGNTSACKIALARNGTSIKLCANGGAVASGTLSSIDVSANQYGKTGAGSVIGLALIKRHARFNSFLSDAAMQALAA